MSNNIFFTAGQNNNFIKNSLLASLHGAFNRLYAVTASTILPYYFQYSESAIIGKLRAGITLFTGVCNEIIVVSTHLSLSGNGNIILTRFTNQVKNQRCIIEDTTLVS
jgi:hypothetical protein